MTALYDTANRSTGAIDQCGGRTTTSYDALNRVTEEIDALGQRGA